MLKAIFLKTAHRRRSTIKGIFLLVALFYLKKKKTNSKRKQTKTYQPPKQLQVQIVRCPCTTSSRGNCKIVKMKVVFVLMTDIKMYCSFLYFSVSIWPYCIYLKTSNAETLVLQLLYICAKNIVVSI